jgi:hypothetical protein
MAAGRRTSEPVNLTVLSPGPLLAAAKAVRLRSAARRWGSKPVLGKSYPACHMSVLGAAVDIRAGEIHDLESARGLVVAATGQAEGAFEEGGIDTSCHPPPHSSAVRPRSVFWPPFLCALQAAARGLAGVWVARPRAVAIRVAGDRAGSAAVPPGLAEREHGAVMALRHWWPDRVDKGDGGGIPGLWRWRLVDGKLA